MGYLITKGSTCKDEIPRFVYFTRDGIPYTFEAKFLDE